MKTISPITTKGSAEWFAGDVYPTIVFVGEAPSRARMANVHFTPCARTAWHTHAVGQYIHVTEGTAFVQERGCEKKVLRPGDTVYTEPGVEHWHGASPDCSMIHTVVWETPDCEEPETIWGEHVTDEEYNK